MSDPLSLLPFALAARSGHVDGMAVAPLVAAGVTLLQRAAPLVRALATGRSAMLLDSMPALILALAASDGHEAVLLDPGASWHTWRAQLDATDARAIFTSSAMLPALHALLAVADGGSTIVSARPRPVLVLLDDAPREAHVLLQDRTIVVDLGSHHGLALEGDQEATGRDEPCVLLWMDGDATVESATRLSHREVFARCRSLVQSLGLTDRDIVRSLLPVHTAEGFIAAMAPLLVGAGLVGPLETAPAVLLGTPTASPD